MTKEDVKQLMIAQIKKETGKTIEQVMKETLIKYEYGALYGEYNFSNFSLIYIGNDNFCNGIKNGYGKGWYFKAKFIIGCGVNYIKIK